MDERAYVHGYDLREAARLQDQASTLADLLHFDTSYPAGSRVLELGCAVGDQTIALAQRSPNAVITAVDISADSIQEARRKTAMAGLGNVHYQQADIFDLPRELGTFDHLFISFVLEHLSHPT